MIVRITSAGWETFTGSMGHGALFKDGVSVGPLNARQVARIGSTVKIIDVETGNQVGPAEIARLLQSRTMTIAPVSAPAVDTKAAADAEAERQRLVQEEKDRLAAQAVALQSAQDKADEDVVIYSRTELEAIGANDGIQGLREIATPLGIKARSISEMVTEILKAQSEKVAG